MFALRFLIIFARTQGHNYFTIANSNFTVEWKMQQKMKCTLTCLLI